jgi:hypothetical protein
VKKEFGIEESKAFATGLLHGIEIVADYMKACYPAISEAEGKPETGYKTSCLKRLWIRAYLWLNTLRRLIDPLDFQAISVGNRTLLELLVDLILLKADKTYESAAKIFWWAESEKLQASEQIVDFFNGHVPDEYEPQRIFYITRKPDIEEMRKKWWPDKDPKQHPKRWTGRKSLRKDIEEADRVCGSDIGAELGSTLSEYFQTQYRKMNWQIHSGIASLGDQPPEAFYLSVGFAFKRCADFAMLVTRIVLSELDLDMTIQNSELDWNRVRNKQDSAFVAALYNFHSQRNS